MKIFALATVRDVVPAAWVTATGFWQIADPATLEAFMRPISKTRELVYGEGLRRAGGSMNAGLWAVVQHTRDTQVAGFFRAGGLGTRSQRCFYSRFQGAA